MTVNINKRHIHVHVQVYTFVYIKIINALKLVQVRLNMKVQTSTYDKHQTCRISKRGKRETRQRQSGSNISFG